MCLATYYLINLLRNRAVRERVPSDDSASTLVRISVYAWDKNMKVLVSGLGFITVVLLIR